MMITQTKGNEMAMTAEALAGIVPVVTLNPNGHRHHDVLATTLDLFCRLSTDEKAKSDLRWVVAQRLLHCRCREGRAIRLAVRLAVGDHPKASTPINLDNEVGTWEKVGSSQYHANKRGDIIKYPNAYAKKGRPIYHPSTVRVVVSADVVLRLAGLGGLLPTVTAASA